MTNMIKCKGIDCIKSQSCQRYVNAPAANQEYFARVPITGEHCRFYVPLDFTAIITEIVAEIKTVKKPVRKPVKPKRSRVPGVKAGK